MSPVHKLVSPHRDPDTGQFVAGASPSTSYNNLDIQRVHFDASIEAADLDGSTGQAGGQSFRATPFQTRKPAGGIPRNAVAELVYIDLNVSTYINSTTTADNTVKAAVEMSSQQTANMVGDVDNNIDSDEHAGTFDRVDSADSTDSDVFAFATSRMTLGPFDSAAGVGGGAAYDRGRFTKNYVGEHGEGPFFEREDEFSYHIAVKQWNLADAALHIDVDTEMLWHVDVS